MIIGSYTGLHQYLRGLSNTGRFWHDVKHPASGDLSGTDVVKLSDDTNTTWNFVKSGSDIISQASTFNGQPGYKMTCGGVLESTNFDCSDCFSLSEGSFVMVAMRGGIYSGINFIMADDWQSYFYINMDLGGAADSDSIKGFFNGVYKEIALPGANIPFVVIARWKTGTGYTIETGEDSDGGTFASDMPSGLNDRDFQMWTGTSAGNYVYHSPPFMMDRYLTDQEVYNIKVSAKSLGCKFTG